jgi:hypothetical protein
LFLALLLSHHYLPGGLLIFAECDFGLRDEGGIPLEILKYNPSLSMDDNLKNPRGLSWHAAWFREIGRATLSPKHQQPPDLIKKTPLSVILEKDILAPFGWEGEDLKHGKEIWKRLQASTEVR